MLLNTSRLLHLPWLGGGAAALAVVLWALVPLLVTHADALPPLRLSALALLAGALGTLPMACRGVTLAPGASPPRRHWSLWA